MSAVQQTGAPSGSTAPRRRAHVDDVVDLGLVVLATAAAVLAVLRITGPLPGALVLLVVTVLPGRAAVRLLPPLGAWARWALALTLGPALLTLGATAMAFTGRWHPLLLGTGLCVAAALVVLLDLRRPGRSVRDDRPTAEDPA